MLQSGSIRGPFLCFCQLQQALIRDIGDGQLSQRIDFKFDNDYDKFHREVESMMGSLDYFVPLWPLNALLKFRLHGKPSAVVHAYLINPTTESAPFASGNDVLNDGSITTEALRGFFSNSPAIFISDVMPWRLDYRTFMPGEKSRPKMIIPNSMISVLGIIYQHV